MHHNQKYLVLMLAVPAVLCSRTVFALFHDPEGPNVLVVIMLATVIYLVAAAAYLSNLLPSLTGFKRGLAAVFVQIVVATSIFLILR